MCAKSGRTITKPKISKKKKGRGHGPIRSPPSGYDTNVVTQWNTWDKIQITGSHTLKCKKKFKTTF